MTDEKQKDISDLTHDIRTKLFAVTGYAEALQSGIARTKETREKYLAALLLTARDMSYLLDTLSAVNREGALTLHPGPQNLAALIRNFFTARGDELRRKHVSVSLQLSELPEISLDAGAFSRILGNLLENTLKYKRKRRRSHLSRQRPRRFRNRPSSHFRRRIPRISGHRARRRPRSFPHTTSYFAARRHRECRK